jgi:hypothetical protein
MSSYLVRVGFFALALAIVTPALAADDFGLTADEFVAAVNQRWHQTRPATIAWREEYDDHPTSTTAIVGFEFNTPCANATAEIDKKSRRILNFVIGPTDADNSGSRCELDAKGMDTIAVVVANVVLTAVTTEHDSGKTLAALTKLATEAKADDAHPLVRLAEMKFGGRTVEISIFYSRVEILIFPG